MITAQCKPYPNTTRGADSRFFKLTGSSSDIAQCLVITTVSH